MTTSDGLTVTSLSVRFGGLVAVNGLSFEAPMGRLTGLIGPNGAGKTTTFNACTGLVRPAEGEVWFRGTNISRLGPHSRARLGLGRTFQRLELFDHLSVIENVFLAREARLTGSRLLGSLWSKRDELATVQRAAADAIELCRLEHLSASPVAILSTGQRRLVELARAIAAGFEVLLLDEPSSGLDAQETHDLGHILTTVVAERDVGILLVEHDMSLVTSVCEYLYVLDFGTLVMSGSVEEAVRSDIVRAAYLGAAIP